MFLDVSGEPPARAPPGWANTDVTCPNVVTPTLRTRPGCSNTQHVARACTHYTRVSPLTCRGGSCPLGPQFMSHGSNYQQLITCSYAVVAHHKSPGTPGPGQCRGKPLLRSGPRPSQSRSNRSGGAAHLRRPGGGGKGAYMAQYNSTLDSTLLDSGL
jgi:hypothetical protein